MKRERRLSDTDRNLLVAQLVLQEAVLRHRTERTDRTQRMVQAAQEDLTQARRDAMLASWAEKAAQPMACPRCGESPTTHLWIRGENADPDEAAAEAPPWAVAYAQAGVSAATHYSCEGCEFEVSLLSGEQAS